jgi:cobalamin biosynthesis Co2+ chelatase CbiK
VINDTSSYDPILEIPYVPKTPYPKRLKASSHFGKQEEKIQDMMETFKQIKVNIPLLDAIKQVPAYVKFLKDLCTQKRKNQKHIRKKIVLIEQVSSLI